jgi:hypothetical protein
LKVSQRFSNDKLMLFLIASLIGKFSKTIKNFTYGSKIDWIIIAINQKTRIVIIKGFVNIQSIYTLDRTIKKAKKLNILIIQWNSNIGKNFFNQTFRAFHTFLDSK